MIKVSCAVLLAGGKVLVAQRSETMSHPLKWEFPGGKVEKGESEEGSLIREITEELEVEIDIKNRLSPVMHSYGDKTILLIPFIAQIARGEIKLKEHKAYLWLAPGELLQLDWAEADLPIVQELISLFPRLV
ncbi:(deoxy)nucleoside triphosphate pyrophosphohydrolase [Pedobacter sp. SYSU D00535]|uniref:(deoxy)nucleoside triphosphate pyrophosphohydrolase n=1 Tax=Pedobacter sp. SYSU D00535 TaxID=2810308 RepID=UPI001A958A8A|nr:(deoxy)nucleoside triphosphate pyrophosphohydrolase [Pedobacter sp. SYSU D00535]